MAISLRAVGAYVNGTSNLTPVIPAAQVTGDMMLCFYGTKPYSDAPTIDQGWASLGSAADGTVAAGIDVGSMQTRVFWKIAVSDTETNPLITNSTNNVSGAVIIVFQKGASESWATLVGAGGGDATAGTDFSVTVGSDVGHGAGDMVALASSHRSESAVPTTARNVTITGCTMGTYVQSPSTDLTTTSGGDMSMSTGYRPVNSGTSSAAPVITRTLAAAHTGSAYAVRLRVLTPITVTPGVVALATAAFVALVLAPVVCTPGTASLTATKYTPTVDVAAAAVTVTPGTASVATTRYVPIVSVSDNVWSIPGVASLASAKFTPTVLSPRVVIPGTKSLTTSAFQPTVLAPIVSVPGTASLATTAQTPTVEATADVVVTPGAATLTTSRFEPTVLAPRIAIPGTKQVGITAFPASAAVAVVIIPGVGELALSQFSATITATANVWSIPGPLDLLTTRFAPTVSTGGYSGITVTPGCAHLVTTRFFPMVWKSCKPLAILYRNSTVCYEAASYAYRVVVGAYTYWLAADDCKDDFLDYTGEPGEIVGTVTKGGLDYREDAEVCGPRPVCSALYSKWSSAGMLKS